MKVPADLELFDLILGHSTLQRGGISYKYTKVDRYSYWVLHDMRRYRIKEITIRETKLYKVLG